MSRDFFGTMGIAPARGRTPRAEEHAPGAGPVVVVSDAFWRTHLGGVEDWAGRTLEVGGHSAEIVGVMPPGFEYPGRTAVWVPIELTAQGESRTAHNWWVIGRLGEGETVARADAELDGIVEAFTEADTGAREAPGYADYYPAGVTVSPLLDAAVSSARRPLWLLMAAAGLVLLVGCINLASTALARGTTREREVAVRRSLGARQRDVSRLLFTESLVLALAGGALGLGLAAAILRVLPALAGTGIPRLAEVGLDPLVLAFTAGTSVLTAVMFGLVPAFRSAEEQLSAVLRTGGRGGSDRAREGLWSGLVAAEVALALLLLVGAVLLIRSFATVLAVDGGFRTEGVLLAAVNPPSTKYPTPAARWALYERVREEVRALPGVARAGIVARPPLDWAANGLVAVRGGPVTEASGIYQLADPEYFAILDIPLLRGRLFDGTERVETEHVVVVSQSFAALDKGLKASGRK